MPVIGVPNPRRLGVKGVHSPPLSSLALTASSPRKERLALCIFDLTRCDPVVRQMLLSGKLDTSGNYVVADKERPDERGVILSCPIEIGSAVCDILRNHDRKAGDYPTRVYLNRGNGSEVWTRLPADVVLTLIREIDGKSVPVLNPAIFPPECLPAVAPSTKALTVEDDSE